MIVKVRFKFSLVGGEGILSELKDGVLEGKIVTSLKVATELNRLVLEENEPLKLFGILTDVHTDINRKT